MGSASSSHPKAEKVLRGTARQESATNEAASSSEDSQFREILSKVKECSQNLNCASYFTEDEDTFKGLNYLIEVYYILSKRSLDKLQQVCEVMIDSNILKSFVKMWDELHQNSSEFYSGDLKNFSLKFFMRFKILLWNYSDKCKLLCKEAYYSQVINRLMKEYTLPELDIETLTNQRIRHLMKANLGILHNFLRNFNKNREHVRKDNGIDVILKYYKSTYLIIKAKVVIVLAYCINEEENEKIMAGTGTIQYILSLLQSALESSSHIGKTYAFSALEVVLALNKLASNDGNKETIVNTGVLMYLVQLLDTEGTCTEEENLAAVNCIWALSFHPNNKDKIMKEQGIIEGIRTLKLHYSSNQEMQSACSSTLFVLGVTPDHNLSFVEGREKHIMLSYQWDVQPVILKLRDFLKSKNFLIWMDVEQMKDSILEAMAEAVENSAVVLIAITENYKNSNPCRTEAEYTYKRSIPIIPLLLQSDYVADGWLGAMIGTKLYVDLSNEASDQKFNEILQHVSKLTPASANTRHASDFDTTMSMTDGRHNTGPRITENRLVPLGRNPPFPTSPGKSPSDVSVINMGFLCSSWDKVKVKEWCTSIGIKDKNLNNCDGMMLAQLCKLMLRSPDMYYNMMYRKLKLEDILILTDALEKLISPP